jgi:hypothetical protein
MFTDQPIDMKTLETIIQCGIRAPSTRNAKGVTTFVK